MAIYSLNHKAIGKKTQERPYTASAHVAYITRPKALSRLDGARMPVSKTGAMAFLDAGEDRDRVNGRVADKVMLALPLELTPEQRAQLVRQYAEGVTKGRAPWLAAFHDKGKDARNPHCHLLIRDRDPETGKRVIGLSENGSTQRLREAWEAHANRALEEHGHAGRIDRRTLAEQGRPGPATIHEGPKGHAMARRGRHPTSRVRTVRNAAQARKDSRAVNYPAIDAGRSRGAYNAQARALREKEGWEAVDTANQKQELDGLRDIHKRPEGQLAEAKAPRRRKPSVSGGHPAPVAGIVFQQSGRRLGQPAIDDVRVGAPGGPLGRDVGRAAVPPTPDRIPGAQALDERANSFEEAQLPEVNPVSGELPIKSKNANSKEVHTSKFADNARTVKEKAMSDDDEMAQDLNVTQNAINKHKADQSEGRFRDLMERSYLDPKTAEGRMDSYRDKHGNEGLYKKLEETPRHPYFGRRPGSILSTDGYSPGAGERRQDSRIARQSLPDATRDYHRDKEQAAASDRALGIGQERLEKDAARPPKTSFAERQQQRDAQAKAPEAAKEQKERDLERMRQSREEDKERGR